MGFLKKITNIFHTQENENNTKDDIITEKKEEQTLKNNDLDRNNTEVNQEPYICFENGIAVKVFPFSEDWLTLRGIAYDCKNIYLDNILYDFDKIEDVQKIPVFDCQNTNDSNNKCTELLGIYANLDYFLRIRATQYKKDNLELAIALLKKANELMINSSIAWQKKDYLRLVNYLRMNQQFDEARQEEDKIDELFSSKSKDIHYIGFQQTLETAKTLGTDLVEMSKDYCTCGECAKYQGRIFSISGKDSRFPKLPEQVFIYGGIHKGCRHTFHTYTDGISTPQYCTKEEAIAYSNRPFIDDRSEEEKAEYEKKQQEEKMMIQDRINYDKICEFLPDIAPKSFGGYRKMKNSNSKNFQKILEEAKKKGIDI